MKKIILFSICVFVFTSAIGWADTFGTGDNQFTIDFVTISGSTNPSSGYGIVANDYRIGTFEITNDQWTKFENEYGTVYGNPPNAYNSDPYWTGTNVPTNNVSWYEAAQFVNWLNINTSHDPAYKFTGTQGTSDYSFGVWEPGDVGYDASNPYRNSNAYYFLPTMDEWFKAAYWNGTSLQTYATIDNSVPVAGVDTNYDYAIEQPWNVGSGSEELNGTYDMMGNVLEWTESPYTSGDKRYSHGGTYQSESSSLRSTYTGINPPYHESYDLGFRVASIPEPASLVLLGLGGLVLCYRKR